jgi:two-component system, LytTR family, sensor kinase
VINLSKINTINFWLQCLLWLFFYYTVVYHFIEWLPTVGMIISTPKVFLYSFIYLILLGIVPYANSYYLLQHFYRKQKKVSYYVSLLVGVILSLILFVGLDYVFVYPNIPFWFFIPLHFLSRLPYVLLFIIVVYLFKMRSEFYEQQTITLQLEKEKSEAELQFLKAQINPHFLFNTLNNIQALSFTNPQKASDTIVNLSNLFRYISYEGKRDKVTIKEEVDYIKNYLSLSVMKKLWLNKVSFETNIHDDSILLEPLLLINFIENAFKHGSLDDDTDFIKINLSTTKNQILFNCSNTFLSNNKPSGLIGIENVKKRLNLVYPNRYSLAFKTSNTIYECNLTINHAH